MLTDEQTPTVAKADTVTPATPLGNVDGEDDIDQKDLRIAAEGSVIGPLAKLRDIQLEYSLRESPSPAKVPKQ